MSISRRVIAPTTSSSQRVPEAADDYLSRGWFPVNGSHLREIKEKLQGGSYNGDVAALVADLRTDYALLTYCLSSMRKGAASPVNPLDTLTSLSMDEFKKLLSVSEGDISNHSFGDILKAQALRFKHTVISCSTGEAIAERTGSNGDLMSSYAILRQIGLHLVAWNYPRVYSKALTTALTTNEDLEAILKKQLGFSPRGVGARITLGQMPAEVRLGLGLESPREGSDNEAAHVSRLCDIGEAFAKINDPEHFPADTRNWKTVVSSINHYLGPKGISIIRERVEANCANYIAVAPKIFETDLSPEKNLEIANQHFAQTLLSTNGHAAKMEGDLKEILFRIYALIRPGQISTDALQLLVSELVPQCGFSQGCVFLIDSSSQALVPRLRIGRRPLNHYKSFLVGAVQHLDNPIVDALYSPTPIKQDNALLFGENVSHVSGAIGQGDKAGVLYLEMGSRLAEFGGMEAVRRFRAIRHTLNDCLALGQLP